MAKQQPSKFIQTNVRLFRSDVEVLKKLADESGLPWHVELRMLVKRTLAGERREVLIIKDEG